jgi:hypothetical protein
MTFLPIVARELRVAARRRNTYLGRVGAALVSIVIAGFWLPVFASQTTTSQGRLLFSILSTLAFGYCLLAGTRLTSDCLSAEKREGTIGLLFLTDLRGYDVVLGKLVSCSLNAFYGLLAILPVLALALLLGGVTLDEVGRMALLFLNTLFFSMAAGVFVSTISRNDRRAMFATGCVILLATAAPYALAWSLGLAQWLRSGPGGPRSFLDPVNLLELSPVFAFQILSTGPSSSLMVREFYETIIATHALGWMFLVAASLVVPRVCRERPPGRLGSRWLDFRNRWSYGKPVQRLAFRARLLDRNAFYWLAARDRIKAYYVWFFVGALALIWAWSGWVLTNFVFDWDVSFGVLFLLFVFFKVWLTSEVCARLVEDRANGAFELLLSSPLDLPEMAQGQTMALWRQFGKPVVLALVLTFLLLISALGTSHDGLTATEVKLMFATLMILLVADLATLKWLGMWHAITSTQINRAILAACTRALLLPTAVCLVLYGLYVLLVQASDTEHQLGWGQAAALWLVIGLGNDLFFGLRARWRFLHQFREVATQRFAASKPGLEPFLDVVRSARRWLWSEPGTVEPALGSSLRWKRWLTVAPLVVLAAALASFLSWRHSLNHRKDATLAAMRLAGEPVTIPALQSWSPVIADEENAGILFQKAVSSFWWPNMLPKNAPGLRKLDWPGPVAPISPELRSAVVNLIARNQQALELLHAGAKLPKSRYPVYWTSVPPQMAYWQALAKLRPLSEVLEFEALLMADQGNTPGAIQAIETLFGLARAMGQEPYLAAQHHRIGYLHAAVQALERVLNYHCLTDDQLHTLSQDVREAMTSTGPSLARAFSGERCLAIDEFASPAQQRMGWMGPGPTGVQKVALDLVSFTAQASGLRDLQLLQQLRALENWKTKARQMATSNADALLGSNSIEITTSSEPRDRLAAAEAYWRNVLTVHLETVARLRTAQAALGVEQFRSAHFDQLPDGLDQLKLESLVDVPTDPFTAGPLRYQRLAKGYLIYSVGRDRRDNGGFESASANRYDARRESDLPFRVERHDLDHSGTRTPKN